MLFEFCQNIIVDLKQSSDYLIQTVSKTDFLKITYFHFHGNFLFFIKNLNEIRFPIEFEILKS